ncbi:fasciclin domain-containing protein [Agrococcus jejuensis]|uniref:Uncaracterized surface protein containing fasciclin (FAS1) repeats n=1 Tax=Agrococcus jejuensis TaxID=399736 RepID=A0A1G8GSE3_9MICO|nr:fasciclin domain-containing protein [Agrococcus jejuensis]SDH97286.1 Uncaracterized surface protein containing fasciclin (FAS1) repeats [Agrococcus jejuensis]
MLTRRNPLTAGLVLAGVATFALVGCSTGTSDSGSSESSAPETSASEAPETSAAADPAANLVGSGCAAYAEAVPDGSGSVEGMAQDPVAVAASNNPLLTTLTAAVSGGLNPDVNLVDTLNGDEFTVFAPVDDAFAALPADTVAALQTPEGAATLTSVLTYHVIPGQIAPDDIDGEHTTVNGATLTVEGSGDNITVNGTAAVICGGVQTANATVYLIDSVLMPPM